MLTKETLAELPKGEVMNAYEDDRGVFVQTYDGRHERVGATLAEVQELCPGIPVSSRVTGGSAPVVRDDHSTAAVLISVAQRLDALEEELLRIDHDALKDHAASESANVLDTMDNLATRLAALETRSSVG